MATSQQPATARIGIDLGGTKIEVAALARDDGRVLLRERVPTPQGDYDAILRAIGGLVARCDEALGTAGAPVGIGMPGTNASATPASIKRIAGAMLARRAIRAVPASTASRIRKI